MSQPRISFVVSPQVYDALRQLVATGYYGTSVAQCVREMVYRAVREIETSTKARQ